MRNYFNENRESLELDNLNSEVESRGATYVNEEDIFAAYIMGSVDINKLHLVAGVRYERTDFSTSGMRVELVENEETDVEEVVNTPWEAERDYDHWLPSVNARYTVSDKLQLRAAYTQTISRPKFEDVAAFQIIESKTEEDDGVFVTEREAEVGKPDLQPYEAQNVDLSIEYYPNNGFIISANATFTDSEATTFLDGEKFDTQLPNQSDRIGNITIGYEANDFSVRLATTYKSDNFEEIDGDMLRFEDDHVQVDFMARYYINDSMQMYFNGINLGDEPFYNYFDTRNQNAQYEEYGRTFELGFTWQLN